MREDCSATDMTQHSARWQRTMAARCATVTISCDDFGDCGTQKITIIHHLDSNDIEASKARVVYEFAPG